MHAAAAIRPTTRLMRLLFLAAAALVLGTGLLLFLFPRSMGTAFAFPIDPPLTAAFLGAGYLAAFVVEALSARARHWADARAAVPGVLAFTALTGAVSWLAFASLNRSAPIAWVWLAVYSGFPLILAGALVLQLRTPGADPPVRRPAPPILRGALALTALSLLPAGAGLILFPLETSDLWPWAITPPGAAYRTDSGVTLEPYIGCWLVGSGIVSLCAAHEPDAARLRPILAGAAAFGTLQLAAIARFHDTPDWSSPWPWIYTAGLLAVSCLGVAGLTLARPVRIVAPSAS